jgi:hypothetical protein
MRKITVALFALALATACPPPTTVVRTPDTRPSIAIAGAPEGSLLLVDGQPVGPAPAYSGQPNVLLLEPGVHDVEIQSSSGVSIFRQKVFVESELKTIRVH